MTKTLMTLIKRRMSLAGSAISTSTASRHGRLQTLLRHVVVADVTGVPMHAHQQVVSTKRQDSAHKSPLGGREII